MGGRIGVKSEVGAGSEFHFTIRAAAAEVPAATRRDLSGVQPSLRGKRVLVVDDNATNRRILTSHLGRLGDAARGPPDRPLEALDWIQAGERFDVGILDMHMPEMDGVTLARGDPGARRREPRCPWSSSPRSGGARRAPRSEGFAAYLHKPIKPSQLFDALVSVLAEQPVHVRERAARRGASSTRTWPAGTRCASSWPRTTSSTRRWRSGSSGRWATGPTWPPTGSRPSTRSSGRPTTWS